MTWICKNDADRNKVMIQTPQGFSYPLLMEAYDKMMSREEYQEGATDDAMVGGVDDKCKGEADKKDLTGILR